MKQKITLAQPHYDVLVDFENPDDKQMCKGKTCNKTIFWATKIGTSKRIPISLSQFGKWVEHHTDCPNVKQF